MLGDLNPSDEQASPAENTIRMYVHIDIHKRIHGQPDTACSVGLQEVSGIKGIRSAYRSFGHSDRLSASEIEQVGRPPYHLHYPPRGFVAHGSAEVPPERKHALPR